jgi:hypothetical protein
MAGGIILERRAASTRNQQSGFAVDEAGAVVDDIISINRARVWTAVLDRTFVRSVRDHLNQSDEIQDKVLINTQVARIEVQSDQLVLELINAKVSAPRSRRRKLLKLPWQKTPFRRRPRDSRARVRALSRRPRNTSR